MLPIVESPKARPGCPILFAIGQPSSVVAADAGVPGVFKRIAEMLPPQIAPQYTPSSMMIPCTPSKANVSGYKSAIPIFTESPGIAPIRMPAPVPTIRSSKVIGDAALAIAAAILFNISSPPYIKNGSGSFVPRIRLKITQIAASATTVTIAVFFLFLSPSTHISAGISISPEM